MTKTKKAPHKKAKAANRKPRALAKSNHPIGQHVSKIADLVHGALASAGIRDLKLSAMHFSANASSQDPCDPGEHREWVCTTGADGSQVCEWQCVAN